MCQILETSNRVSLIVNVFGIFLVMDEQYIYNTFFVYLSTIFARFVLALGSQDNPLQYSATRCPPGYLSRITVDRQLIGYLLPTNARIFIHHLSEAVCGCRYCDVAAQLPIRSPRARFFRCCVRRWSYFCACISRFSRNRAGVNTPPVNIVLVDGVYLVTRISHADASRLYDALNMFIPSNPLQAKLLIDLLASLSMVPLPLSVLHRHFERHISI